MQVQLGASEDANGVCVCVCACACVCMSVLVNPLHYTNITSHLRIFSSTSLPLKMPLSSGTGFTLKT